MIRIIEVGPRDGLQNETTSIPTPLKITFITALAEAGLKEIEAASFVSPKWVPQLGDAAEVLGRLPLGPAYSALVPNLKGLERAVKAGVDRIALFTATSDAFTKKNINMTVAESLLAFDEVMNAFRQAVPGGLVRGYVSTAFECPYSGRVDLKQTAKVAGKLLEMGCDEISVGDTVGVAAPSEVRTLTPMLLELAPVERFAYHFHDTNGTAVANVQAALDLGIRAFDASAGGLGGCPYAPGAGGNLATEDLVHLLHREGIDTGVDPKLLANASLPVLELLGRPPASKAQVATLARSRQTPV